MKLKPPNYIVDYADILVKYGKALSSETRQYIMTMDNYYKSLYPDRKEVFKRMKNYSLTELFSMLSFVRLKLADSKERLRNLEPRVDRIQSSPHKVEQRGKRKRPHILIQQYNSLDDRCNKLNVMLLDLEFIIENYEQVRDGRRMHLRGPVGHGSHKHEIVKEKFKKLKGRYPLKSTQDIIDLIAADLDKSTEATKRGLYYNPKKLHK
jgi:hypothetical protein